MKTSYFLKHLAGTLLFFSLLFISAGRLDYLQGWIYSSIGLLMLIVNYSLLRTDPELLKERSRPGEGTKKWDKAILGLSFLVTVAMYVTAGLDSGRFHLSPDFHPGLGLAGAVFTATGQLLFLVAQKQNKFFSSTVRIQSDRGHTVCDSGLYKFVRHPAYLGTIVQAAGFPLLMGSCWSILPAVLSVVLVLVRTSLEDRTLRNELKGYPDYAGKTRYRILPLIW